MSGGGYGSRRRPQLRSGACVVEEEARKPVRSRTRASRSDPLPVVDLCCYHKPLFLGVCVVQTLSSNLES